MIVGDQSENCECKSREVDGPIREAERKWSIKGDDGLEISMMAAKKMEKE